MADCHQFTETVFYAERGDNGIGKQICAAKRFVGKSAPLLILLECRYAVDFRNRAVTLYFRDDAAILCFMIFPGEKIANLRPSVEESDNASVCKHLVICIQQPFAFDRVVGSGAAKEGNAADLICNSFCIEFFFCGRGRHIEVIGSGGFSGGFFGAGSKETTCFHGISCLGNGSDAYGEIRIRKPHGSRKGLVSSDVAFRCDNAGETGIPEYGNLQFVPQFFDQSFHIQFTAAINKGCLQVLLLQGLCHFSCGQCCIRLCAGSYGCL